MRNRTADNIMAFFAGLLLFFCVFQFVEPANAAEADEPATCKQLGELAEAIMKNRQTGSTMDRMIEIVGDDELMMMIVIDAYDSPRYSTQDYIDKAVIDFKNKWLLNCYKARKGK